MERLAKKFHEIYERLAPKFNYKTRKRSAVKWEDVPEDNKQLMIATVTELFKDTTTLYAIRDKETKRYLCIEDTAGLFWDKDPIHVFRSEQEIEYQVFCNYEEEVERDAVEIVTLNITITPVEKGKVEDV